MRVRRTTRTLVVTSVAVLSIFVGGCNKDSKDSAKELGKAADPAKPVTDAEKDALKALSTTDPTALAAKVGVEPGGVDRGDEGAAAVITSADGTVLVRRLGEGDFSEAKAQASLYAGDQIKTDSESTATLVLVDETVIEVAGDSAIAIGDRDASADPASSAAVLYGAARFSVSPRAPGEGPFLVFTPGGVIATKGTVYAVGVAASGEARVGVEVGEVLVAGAQALDKTVAVVGGKSVEIEASGDVGGSADFAADDWAEWRIAAEADADAKALAEMHVKALGELDAKLDAAYVDFSALAEKSIEVDAQADAQASAGATAEYEAAAPEYGATVEASYLASMNLQYLTYANLSHAYVVEELYIRHPVEVKPIYLNAEAQVNGAVLWNKKFNVVVYQQVRPLRVSYYAHHPVGRANAVFVGYAVPAFYGNVKLRAVPAASVRAHVKGTFFVPPPPVYSVKVKRKVWITAPDASWKGRIQVKAMPARAGAGWKAHGGAGGKLMLGVRATAPRITVFAGAKVRPINASVITVQGKQFGGAVRGRVGVKVKGGAAMGADVGGGARGKIEGGVGTGVEIRDHGAKAGVEIRDHGKAGLDAAGKGAGQADAAIKGGVKGSIGVKVKAPKPPPPPKVKVEGDVKVKAKGGIKIGN